jgi:hypothetical protein
MFGDHRLYKSEPSLKRIGESGIEGLQNTIDNLNRNVHDPRALAAVLEKAEADLAQRRHPDPYISESALALRTTAP